MPFAKEPLLPQQKTVIWLVLAMEFMNFSTKFCAENLYLESLR